MESYNKKYLTGKISKSDKQLKYLDNLVPNGIVKDSIKDEMRLKKKSMSKKLTKCEETKNFQSTKSSGSKGKKIFSISKFKYFIMELHKVTST